MSATKIWLPLEILKHRIGKYGKNQGIPSNFLISNIYIYGLLSTIVLNPFQVKVPFLHPLKTTEHFWFYDVFQGYRNVILA